MGGYLSTGESCVPPEYDEGRRKRSHDNDSRSSTPTTEEEEAFLSTPRKYVDHKSIVFLFLLAYGRAAGLDTCFSPVTA